MKREILNQILEAEGIEETLLSMAKDKQDYYLKLQENVVTLLTNIHSKKLEADTVIFWELVIFHLYGGEELDKLEREINLLCYHVSQVTNIQESKSEFKQDWQKRMDRIDGLQIQEVIGRYINIPNGCRLIQCPIHEDRTPSLKIYPHTNSWYCFGCGKGGAPVNFLMELEGISFKEAVKKLTN